MKAYEMEMLFTATIGLKSINNMLRQMGDPGKLQIKDALNISIKQVLPCIPDDEYIHKVEQVIIDHYETDEIEVLSCKFTGYKSIKEIETDKIRPKESEGEPT